MAMKRFRSEEVREIDSGLTNLAGVLMMLSRSAGFEDHRPALNQLRPGRVFECKTCNRQFPSFQALGGHRASHKKPRPSASDHDDHIEGPKVHECSICGLEFAVGQALGGHMRRHRPIAAHGHVEKKCGSDGGKRALLLDLNQLPPVEEEVECRKLGRFGFGFVDKSTPMVDCFH